MTAAFAACVTTLAGAVLPAQEPWTQAFTKASWFGRPGDPLLDPACLAGEAGTTHAVGVLDCAGAGYRAEGFAEAFSSGVLRAGNSFWTDGFPPTSGMLIPAGDAPGSAAYAFAGNTLTLKSLAATDPGATSVTFWMRLDGTITSSTGTMLDPTTLAQIAGLGPVHQNYANLHIWNAVDGFRGLYVDWFKVGNTPEEANAHFIGTYGTEAPFGGPVGTPYHAWASGYAVFSDVPVVNDGVEFYFSLQSVATFGNWYSGHDLVYHGATTATRFDNTATLVGVQAFDAAGNDVSWAYSFRLASGEAVAAGDPTVTPEPATLALLLTGSAALALTRRRLRRR